MGTDRYLGSEFGALQREHSAKDDVRDEGFIVQDLVARKSADCVQKVGSGFGELADAHVVNSLVDLQAVTTVPVSTFLYQTRISKRT